MTFAFVGRTHLISGTPRFAVFEAVGVGTIKEKFTYLDMNSLDKKSLSQKHP